MVPHVQLTELSVGGVRRQLENGQNENFQKISIATHLLLILVSLLSRLFQLSKLLYFFLKFG